MPSVAVAAAAAAVPWPLLIGGCWHYASPRPAAIEKKKKSKAGNTR